MKKLMLVVILPLLVGLAFAGPNLSTVSDPNAIRKPADPNAPACVEVPVPPVPVTDAPPPFGTVMQQWTLSMSGGYAGAGITWRRDSGRFYLMAQGKQVWSVDPTNPSGTARQERWVLPDMGSGTADIPWSLAWDNDSSCFWLSNIVDGNIYGGCFYTRIRQSPVGDTWRWVSTNPGDTWQIGTGSSGGPGSMYWMGGSEKWFDRGYFACAPVATSPSTNNYVWKFDPYTKTSIGRCANGDQTSERGCGLVPWDSNYILTTGWNANQHRKRDSTGFALASVGATVYGPADNAVWIPQVIGPDDTVFMYTICSDPSNTLQKISVGLLWNQLPSINPFNVRPLSILAPSGTVDSGQSIIPRLVIRNMSNEAANNVSAFFTIDDGTPGGYSDSVTGKNMAARTTETIPFNGWIPRGRDSMNVVAWTYWPDDSFPKDDTIRNRFLVRVKDIAVTQITIPAPDTVVDSGAVFTPQCRVWNHGNVSLNFDLRFRIGAWQATRNLNLIAGGATLVNAPIPYVADLPGIFACQCFAVVVGDLHPENNIKIDTFTVRGTVLVDVDARAVLAPPGVIDTTMTIIPKGRYGNNGVEAASFWAFFIMQNSGGSEIYAESSQVLIGPGEETEIEFASIKFSVPGNYTAACSVYMEGDQNSTNDVKRIPFRVVDKVTGDIAVIAIVRPPGFVPPDSSFIPGATWKNHGTEEATFVAFYFIHNKYGVRMYDQSQSGVVLAGGAEVTLDFPSFNVGNDTGRWYARCSTAAGDTNFANDTMDKFFTVGSGTPPTPGWLEVAQVPAGAKAVKDGAWLAYDASGSVIFAAKGNKQPDFHAFNPVTGWTTVAPIPPGREGKGTSKGGAGAADGNGKIYSSKGNNTVGFYEYDAIGNMWYQRTDVPLGVSGKKVKGGTGLAWGTKAGVGAVYMLKGYKNEFYKYNPMDSTWTTLTPAPIGGNQKWDKGSWLAADNSGKLLYAHKAKYHEFYTYDTEMDSWSSAKTAMPIPGTAGSKKSKDGGSAAWFEGHIYAFKGGNTAEFWRYTPLGDSWKEMENIPLIGSTGKKKKVKAGGSLAGYPGIGLFALKGNKSLEFWRYVPLATFTAPASREGVMAGIQPGLNGALRISPNPLAGGFATVHYSLPKAGLATLRIYDVTGRTVLSQTMVAGRTGSSGLDLRKLNAGVYLVKVTTEGFSTTQKLVVQH